jgi:short-chain fatty acids transporter
MIRAMGEYFSEWAKKYMPDPWLFAILLSFLTYILGLIFTKSGPFDMILHWHKGFWELLTFAMQMCLILVTGYALATSPVVKRGIDALSRSSPKPWPL